MARIEITDFELRQWQMGGTGLVLPHVEQDLEDDGLGLIFGFRAAEKLAPNDTKTSSMFVKTEIRQGLNEWYRKCLMLQRMARGLPAVYPTALSASLATPRSERILKREDLRRGMVGFCYDPRIPGTAGHIYYVLGRTKDGRILTASNDVEKSGQVDVVDIDFYEKYWGQKFQFGATWLNGYDFSDFNKAPEPVHEGTLGERYQKAMEELKAIEKAKRQKGHLKLADAVKRDVVRMERKLNQWAA